MENSKTYLVIQSLNKSERKQLLLFVQSPYFNPSKDLDRLYQNLLLAIQGAKKSTKEKLWADLSEKPFDDRRWRKYLSDLLKLIERFLAQQIYESNTLRQANYLLEAVTTKRMKMLYKSSVKTARHLSNKNTKKGTEYYYYQFRIEKFYNDLLELEGRTQKLNMENIIANLDAFYMAEKLINYSAVLSHKKVVEYDYEVLFIDEIMSNLEKTAADTAPLLQVYYLTTLLYLNNERSAFEQLKKVWSENVHVLTEQDAKIIFHAELNFCIRKSNQGETEYRRELFELYQFALKNNLMFQNGLLTQWSFKNIITVALRLDEFDWCATFIKDYSDFLQPKYRQNAVTFNTARLHWYKKDFQSVMSLLYQVEFDDFTYNLSAKSILMAAYYELGEIEVLTSFLVSFKIFLKRNNAKLPAGRIKIYLNLISFLSKLIRIPKSDKAKLFQLKSQIENETALVEKKWILEKVDNQIK